MSWLIRTVSADDIPNEERKKVLNEIMKHVVRRVDAGTLDLGSGLRSGWSPLPPPKRNNLVPLLACVLVCVCEE